jgi:Ca2+-binding RTX toxin-like protein
MSKNTNDNGVNDFAFSGNDSVDSILQAQNKRWTLLNGNKITYSFVNRETANLYKEQFGNDYEVSPVEESLRESVQQNIIRKAVQSIIAVDFDLKTEQFSTDINGRKETTDYGTIRIMLSSTQAGGETLGRGHFPASFGEGNPINGDLYLNGSQPYDIGTIGYTTILHELGHTLGLKHPFTGKRLPLNKDNNTYTVMTYNDTGTYNGSKAISFMPYDILALQYLYGARDKNNGDTTYVFTAVDRYSVNGDPYYNFGTSGHSKSTLWDSGGIDTLDFSGLDIPVERGKDGFDYRFDIAQGGFLTESVAYNSASYAAYNPESKEYNGGVFATHRYGTALAFSPLNGSFDATIEKILGSKGNDYIYGNNGANFIRGNAGNDNIYGDSGNDTIYGDSGNDVIYGGYNWDTLYGGADNDEIHGEDGWDTILAGSENDTVYGDSGNDRIWGESGTDTIYGGADLDFISGGDNDDTIYGDFKGDRSNGSSDILDGDDGEDTIYGGGGWDIINGGDKKDYLYGDDGNDSIKGESGNDFIHGGFGLDIISGGTDGDTIYGDFKDDRSNGDADILNGDDGEDTIYGGGGWDIINGGDKKDYLYGDDGNDIINGGGGDDFIDGGSG